MSGDDTARLLYLSLGGAIVLWFFAQNRASLGKVAQQAIVWALIFVGVIAAMGLWGDIRNTVQPGQATYLGDERIELRRAMDGHYYVTAQVNDVPVDFVVDTGATVTVLTREDAARIGINTDKLAFVGRATTANGEVRTAPVTLDSIVIGPVRHDGVRAVVNGGDLAQSLLGMEYLQRYSSIQIADGRLILTP